MWNTCLLSFVVVEVSGHSFLCAFRGQARLLRPAWHGSADPQTTMDWVSHSFGALHFKPRRHVASSTTGAEVAQGGGYVIFCLGHRGRAWRKGGAHCIRKRVSELFGGVGGGKSCGFRSVAGSCADGAVRHPLARRHHRTPCCVQLCEDVSSSRIPSHRGIRAIMAHRVQIPHYSEISSQQP